MRQRDPRHVARITSELKAAGMTPYGFMKLETDHLPEIIHHDEHIKGVAYGLVEKTIDSVMLVATDKRIIFVDCKPFYQNWDEITYDVVSGVKISYVGPFAGVVLHTRVKDFSLRFVNIKCAKTFEKYIDKYIEKISNGQTTTPSKSSQKLQRKSSHEPKITALLEEKPDTAVLSTIGKDGAHGAVVHYVTDKDDNFYIVTKSETTKARNILINNAVALTIHQTDSLKYLEVRGTAEIEQDSSITKTVFSIITGPKHYLQGTKMPPVTKIKDGNFIVLKITPTNFESIDYSTSSW